MHNLPAIAEVIAAVRKGDSFQQWFSKKEIGADVWFFPPRTHSERTREHEKENKITSISFSNEVDFAFFSALRAILDKHYAEEGRILAHTLAVDAIYTSRSVQSYDSLCAHILKDIKMVSLADPDEEYYEGRGVPVAYRLRERWKVNHQNIAPYNGNVSIDTKSPDFIHMGDPRNRLNADIVWASNVVSFGAVDTPDRSKEDAKPTVYYILQTFGALAEMMKPEDGQLLLITTLDRDPHHSIQDIKFLKNILGIMPDSYNDERAVLYKRVSEKVATPLELAKWMQDNNIATSRQYHS